MPFKTGTLDISDATGFDANSKIVQKFGYNPSVAANNTEEIWDGSTTYSGFLTAASALQVASGGNAADVDSTGAGARKIQVEGLNQHWAEASELISLAGASASSATSTTFIRVFRAYVVEVGTYGVANTGDIVIETTGNTTLAQISAGIGQTQMTIYTIPTGFRAYIRRIDVYVEGAKPADVNVYQRQGADTVAAPFAPKRLVRTYPQITGFAETQFTSYPGPFPAKTDIWADATAAAGGSPAVAANIDFALLKS